MSCWSATREDRADAAGWAGEAGRAECAHAAVSASANAARQSVSPAPRRLALFRDLIEHLDHVVEIGLVDLCRPGLAWPRHEDVVAGLSEARAIFLLALVELDHHGDRRLVEAGVGGAVDERRDADVRQLAEQVVALLLVEIAARRRDALPLVRCILALALDAIERDGLPVAGDLDVRRVEGAELEDVLAPVLVRALLDVVEQRALDSDDRRLRRVSRVDGVVGGLAAEQQRRP